MSYRQLQGRLQNYQQAIPEYLQQFFGEYSADPYQGAVLDEYERRNADTFGQNLGQMASYFGGAGRMGGGMMGRSMSDATAENQQRLRGDIGGLLSGDYNNFMQRQMEAAGLMGNLQQTGMAGTAQGYSADQAAAAQRAAARMAMQASMYGTDAQRAIGMGNLNMSRDFGTWDRQYRSDMMPYEQLGMIGQGVGPLLQGFGQQNSQSTSYGPQRSVGGAGLQGFLGGGMQGYGMGRSMFPNSQMPWGGSSGGSSGGGGKGGY